MTTLRSLLILCLAPIGCAHRTGRADQPSPVSPSTDSRESVQRVEYQWKCPFEVASAASAVACAEEFIKANGYTQAPPLPPDKLTFESIEWGEAEWLAEFRHNTLQPKAIGYSVGRRGQSRGWTVVFCFTGGISCGEKAGGRAVTMDEDGSAPRVEHVDVRLDAAEVRLCSCPD